MTSALATMAGVVLACAGVWAMWTRRTEARQGDAIHVVTSRYLGAKRFLTLVEVDGERLLLGVAGERVSLVARLGTPPAAEARPEA